MATIFRDYDRAGLDAQYNLRAHVKDAVAWMAKGAGESGRLRSSVPVQLDVAYGPRPGERCNVFPAKAGAPAPVLVFVHGGYWQRLDKMDFDFVAEPFLEAGAAVVNVNYDLAPRVRVSEIVRQVRAAIAWTWRAARFFNGDPGKIHVAGHSAGGHLTAMAALTDWAAFEPGLPKDPIKSATCISGLYDLEPVRLAYLNDVLGLDETEAKQMSPLPRAPEMTVPTILAVGDSETEEFIRQQRDFAALLGASPAEVEAMEIEDRHHFDVIFDLANPQATLHRTVAARMGLTD